MPETEHQLQVHIDQPLEPGQRVEVGIAEGSLLRSAMLVYLTPLLGMMLGGTLLQYCFGSDASAAVGAVLGGGAAFMLARRLARRLGEQAEYQPSGAADWVAAYRDAHAGGKLPADLNRRPRHRRVVIGGDAVVDHMLQQRDEQIGAEQRIVVNRKQHISTAVEQTDAALRMVFHRTDLLERHVSLSVASKVALSRSVSVGVPCRLPSSSCHSQRASPSTV